MALMTVIAVIFRLLISTSGFHGDIIMQAGWGKWIHDNGIRGFYENTVWIYGWPNHPPIVSWIYGSGFAIYSWINTQLILLGNFIARNHLGAAHMPWLYQFSEWWGNAKYSDTPFKYGELVSMKLWPIIGDAVLAYLIYGWVKIKAGTKKAMLAAGIYLFFPFSWYESAIWGQNDQLGLIFLLLSFWSLTQKKLKWTAPLWLAIGILIKPTSFIFGLLFAWVAFKDKKTLGQVFWGGIISLGGYFWLVSAISPVNFINFNLNLQSQMFVKGEYWTWVNTFNFWRLITPYLTDYRQTVLGINLRIWGFISFTVFNLAVFRHYRKRNWEEILKSIFIIGFGGWMTMTAMHERYLFTAVVAGLILAFECRGLLKYWMVMAAVFTINLYNGWWWPENINWLKNALIWGDYFDGWIPRILAGINTGLLVAMMATIWKTKEEKQIKTSD